MSQKKPARKKAARSRVSVPTCTIKSLPKKLALKAAREAMSINPANAPRDVRIWGPQHLAAVTQKYWGAGGVALTVSFMERVADDLADRIVSHLNAWSLHCNAKFTRVKSGGQVRISLGRGGYWSYLGTDIRQIRADRQTMNLEGLSMRTPESEFVRVVRHEAGHTLGFPHEHLRKELVDKLDPAKTIAYFMRTQNWSEQDVRAQVLTPISEASVMGTPSADATSIMCYQLPGSVTKDGLPIAGGADIGALDREFSAKLYPKEVAPTPPAPPPPGGKLTVTMSIDPAAKTASVVSVA